MNCDRLLSRGGEGLNALRSAVGGTTGDKMTAVHLKPSCFLFLCLFFQGALSACTTGLASECRNANFVPGAQLAGLGYDVVTLEPKGAFVIDMNTWQFANGSCILCHNEHLGNVRQRLPISLVDWRTLSSCRRSISSQLYRSADKLAQSATSDITNDWQVGLHLKGAKLVLAGSKSKLVSFGTSRSKNDRYSFTNHQFQCRYYQYRVKDKPLLAPEFARSLSSLPPNGKKDQYRKLVATYGTHYLMSVELGGHFKDVTAIRTCEVASKGYTIEEVKDCLSMEASFTAQLRAGVSVRKKKCKKMARAIQHSDTVYQAFNDRETEVTGGKVEQGADLFFSGDSSAFSHWMNSLTSNPGTVRYDLVPLHHLFSMSDPKQKTLQRYISDYIMLNALSKQCKVRAPCPHGSYRNPHQRCNCACRENNHVDRNCCPKEKGLGHLVVTVKEGRDLWGDVFTATDGYVVVRYGRQEARTNVISNNNNPSWNTKLDLGEVKASSGHMLTIKVWDQDTIKSDDLLGKCEVSLTSGTHRKVCYLQYGKVTYDYTFTCGPHLGGATCQAYVALPGSMAFTSYVGTTNHTLHLNTVMLNRSEPIFPVVYFP
ncbi:perforin-1-like isoform X1 [Stegostoma tigrinum]|uniref:perforin-1-like isoform X1 n=2 Tax=Stegostoma tigrinum TaxID=3053191 RepID=UPI0028700B8C|nr:perforin-1-like isoform X1 [Stegostoma tigrinum]